MERITHFNSIGIDIDVLRFLVANGADNYKDCIKSCVKFNNYTVFSYFVQEVSFDITYHGDYFLALCDIAFTNPNIYEDKRILEELQDTPQINVLQLIYHHASYEGDQKDYEFSKWTMREHWAAGLEDARRTLSHPEWLKMDQSTGMTLHDVHRDV